MKGTLRILLVVTVMSSAATGCASLGCRDDGTENGAVGACQQNDGHQRRRH